MNPESICLKSISNRINGFRAHTCNYGHAKTQTADRAEHANHSDHSDHSDHANRAHFAREFRLLQLARH